MEKNLIWAVLFSALFLMVWYRFFMPLSRPVKTSSTPVSTESSSKVDNKVQKTLLKEQSSTKTTVLNTTAEKLPKGSLLAEGETEKTIDTPTSRIVVNSRGAAIKHWWLKETGAAKKSISSVRNWPDLVNHPLGSNERDVIDQEKLPLSTFADLNFKEIQPAGSKDVGLIHSVWRATLPSGIELEKEYLWDDLQKNSAKSNFVKLILKFKNPTKKPLEMDPFQIGWGGGLGTIESEKKENADRNRVLAYPSPTREVKVFKTGEYKAEYSWIGLDNRYYLFAMAPKQGQIVLINTEKSKTNCGEAKLSSKEDVLAAGDIKIYELNLYAGPKGYTQLKKWGLGLEHSVDFGMFGFLGKWALKAMDSLYNLTGNYGWAIILLTCVLQVIVLPLSLKSYKSMAGMKKIQPKLQELQKRYKNDHKRLNQEMLNLYKESKTNPFGGCLPMLLQIPIFWAFFTMLRNAYELRGAPWMFWIMDLSQKDPYYILPIVMGAGMFLQQKISGSVGDPTQAKMMAFMPIIFTFMFLNFPSGLVLYWLTNSILSMATQYWCTKKFGEESPKLSIARA